MYNIFSNELYTFTKHNSLFWREQPHGLCLKNKTGLVGKHNSSDGKNTTIIHRGSLWLVFSLLVTLSVKILSLPNLTLIRATITKVHWVAASSSNSLLDGSQSGTHAKNMDCREINAAWGLICWLPFDKRIIKKLKYFTKVVKFSYL